LRGPQFDGAWVDELAKWPKAQDTWDMLQFGLRLGEQPQVCVTTTPRNVPVLKDLLRRDSTVVTHAATSANRANLADSFLEEVEARYAGTRLGRQELAGELLEEEEGALWSIGGLERLQVEQVPDLDRIVVAVEPAETATDRSDTCGIIVVGAVMRGPVQDWRAYVLEDASCPAARPSEWAGQAVAMMRNWDADRLVAEVNQGGDLVESVVRQIDPSVPFTKCHASR
jgi:phage terminase large subunit-like protein